MRKQTEPTHGPRPSRREVHRPAALMLAVVALAGATYWPVRADRGVAPAASQVRTTVPMRTGRAAHTATTLDDGRVLVAGGFTRSGDAPGAELYDGTGATSSTAGPMGELRHSHTATRLATGQVLIVGGYGEGTRTLASAELFDPRTNRFTPAGRLNTPRANHVAVLLPNGTVLIAGGLGEQWTYLASAEIFDPRSGRFTPTASMTVPRESHTAVRLDDGRVLVAGGHEGPRRQLRLHASAEVFDPAAGVFSRVGDMTVRRHKHDAVLLRDGRVLVTGGSDERDDRGAYTSTEFFDVATRAFRPGPSLLSARYKHQGSSVRLPGGDVLVAGGAASPEIYLASRNVFSAVGPGTSMPGLFSATAVLGGGRVLITGGYGQGRGPARDAWLYEP